LNGRFLDKIGAVGAFLVAGSCSACFPLLAVVGSAFGLSFLRPYEGILLYVFQGLVLMALIGNVIAASFVLMERLHVLLAKAGQREVVKIFIPEGN
jgi:hypothetical protein